MRSMEAEDEGGDLEEGRRLVDTLEGRNGLALVLVEGGVDDAAVGELDVRGFRVLLEGEGVLHPVLVVTLCGESAHQLSSR